MRIGLLAAGFVPALLLGGCANAAGDQSGGCVPTEADALGPFYVSGTPVVEDLNRHGKPGEPLQLRGRILSAAAGTPPISGARIEVWQTDGGGDYHPAADGDHADYADEEIDLRGTVISGRDGAYSVRSVVPGGYFPRPRHFHYRITADDHAALVTQLYITGDGVVRQPGGECRHAPLEADGDGWVYRAPDIVLAVE